MKNLFIGLFTICWLNGYGATYFFSTSIGNDLRTSTQAEDPATPWKTISKLNSAWAAGTFVAGDSILLKRGETFYTTVEIIPKTSGTSGNTIVVSAWGTGADPIVTSLLTLSWEAAAAIDGPNLWRSTTAGLTMNSLNCVTVNNVVVEMGRWPNSNALNGGWNTILTGLSDTTFVQKTPFTTVQPAGMYYTNGSSTTGPQVVTKVARFWLEKETIKSRLIGKTVSGVKQPDTIKVYSPVPNYQYNTGWGYFIQNDSVVLDKQTEWWFNPAKDFLKMYSIGIPTGVKAATNDNLVDLTTFKFLVFDNIDFNGCNQDIVVMSSDSTPSKVNIFQNCTFQNAGRNAINVRTYGMKVLNCTIINCQSKGITFTNKFARNSVVQDNYIRNMGQLTGMSNGSFEDGHANHSGVGIYIRTDGAHGHDIQRNSIINSGYAGIIFYRQNNITIKYNFVDSFCNVTDDGGGIYSYTGDGLAKNVSTPTRVVRGNTILHTLESKYGHGTWSHNPGYGNSGVYQDEWTNHVTVDSNTIGYCNVGIFDNNGCNNNIITNNTIYSSNTASLQLNTRNPSAKHDTTVKLTVTGNLCFALVATQYCFLAHQQVFNFIQFGTINNNIYIKPLVANSSNTLFTTEVADAAGNTVATDRTFTSWKSTMQEDAASSLSNIKFTTAQGQTDSTFIIQNISGTPSTTITSNTYVDVYGNTYNGTVVTPAHRTLILFKTGSAPPPPPVGGGRLKIRGKKAIFKTN